MWKHSNLIMHRKAMKRKTETRGSDKMRRVARQQRGQDMQPVRKGYWRRRTRVQLLLGKVAELTSCWDGRPQGAKEWLFTGERVLGRVSRHATHHYTPTYYRTKAVPCGHPEAAR